MRPSRGMGDMKSSKMPGAKTIRRKDNPDSVTMYAKGGKTKAKGKPDKAAKAPGKMSQRARFAQMLKGFKKGK